MLSLALLELCIGTLLHVIGFVEQKSTGGVVNARGAVRCIMGGVLCVRCIMGGGKAVSSAGASFAREYDSGTWWRQLTEGGPPAKTVCSAFLALSRV